MAVCLNTDTAYKLYSMMAHDRYFVDKSGMIEMVSARINCMNRYLCITKPRRFGKTSVFNMLGAYYCKACDASTLFDGLAISRSDTYKTHLNQYNVINLCLNHLPDQGSTYEDYIGLVRNAIKHDVQEAYPALGNREFGSIVDMLTATGEQFIFIIDEWDYIFSHELYPEHHGEFLEFLRNLLKDQPYVSLAYMTGVLPLKKYSTGSALNMFKEYTMLKDPFFGEYFGFTQSEVEMLCKRQSALTIEEKSGKGFADFIFHPKRRNMPGIILELKADDTPEAAVSQIKSKEYCEKLRWENVTNILAVGLSYDTRKKEHQCIIEEM